MSFTQRTAPATTAPWHARRWLIAFALSTTVGLLLAALMPTQDATPETAEAVPAQVPPSHGVPMTAIAAGQHQAEQAVIREIVSSGPDTANVEQRPAYVSELEWQVLQEVARAHANPEQELSHLVRKLHFSRRLELWHAMDNTTQESQRLTLAMQLLEAIPMQVANQDMDSVEAKKLQTTLLDTLIADPVLRAERIDAESRRLPQMITPAESSGE